MINKIILNLMFLTLFIACSSSGNDQNIQDDNISIFQFSKLMDERLNELLELPVPKDWDGVYTAQTK